jgi:hypothetical protein
VGARPGVVTVGSGLVVVGVGVAVGVGDSTVGSDVGDSTGGGATGSVEAVAGGGSAGVGAGSSAGVSGAVGSAEDGAVDGVTTSVALLLGTAGATGGVSPPPRPTVAVGDGPSSVVEESGRSWIEASPPGRTVSTRPTSTNPAPITMIACSTGPTPGRAGDGAPLRLPAMVRG